MDSNLVVALVAIVLAAGIAIHAHWRLTQVSSENASVAKDALELARAALASNRFLPIGVEKPVEPAAPPEPTVIDRWMSTDQPVVY